MSESVFISFLANDGNDIAQVVYDFYRKIEFVVFWSKEEIPVGHKWEDVISHVSYDRLSRGNHEFIVRATDAAGNTREDEFTWNVGDPSAAAPGRQ